MRWTILLILSLSVAFAADEVPSAIKPALDSFETEATKAYLAYQQAVAKAADKASKDMEAKLKAATKSGNLEAANAIKAKMTELQSEKYLTALEQKAKLKASEDLLGNPTKTVVVIHSAKYGANDNFVDITNTIKSRFDVKKNRLDTVCDGFGVADPAKDVVKTLTIEYSINGDKKTLSVKAVDNAAVRINVPE